MSGQSNPSDGEPAPAIEKAVNSLASLSQKPVNPGST
jgi:hypothetical protein